MPTKALVLLALWGLLAPALAADPVPEQREVFKTAMQAIDRGAVRTYERLSADLEDYVLYPYLEYTFLRRYISSRASHERVSGFLTRWPDTPLAGRLREAWLGKLAQRRQWDRFMELWSAEVEQGDGGSDLACYAGRALLAQGKADEAFALAERLWQAGRSQPTHCDPLFAAWIKAGGATPEQALQRIERAMLAGNLGLTRYLERFLEAADRPWIARWRRMHRNPARELARLKPEDGVWSGRLFAYGVRRLAAQAPEKADRIWQERTAEFTLGEADRAAAARYVALVLAWRHHDSALERLTALPGAWHDAESRAWRVRSALRAGDWEGVLAGIGALQQEEQAEPDWIYWKARALEALDRPEAALALYRTAAQCRCYYGFLAAEHAGLPPAIETQPLPVDETQLAQMAAQPAMRRIHELYLLDMEVEARREWRELTARLPTQILPVAAKLADSWGWHDQAILTLGRTEFLHDLELRFPTPFAERVATEAQRRELDRAFIYAVMRQESAFHARARSPVGALGLMQLMPATAKRTGRQIRHPVSGTWDILDVDNNIRLGTAHLRALLDRYHGNRFYTMAAYNAGPHRVTRWLPETVMPGDIWVATMPYDETREYVKRVFAYTVIYEWRLGKEPTPLSQFLPAATPDGRPLRLTGDGPAVAG